MDVFINLFTTSQQLKDTEVKELLIKKDDKLPSSTPSSQVQSSQLPTQNINPPLDPLSGIRTISDLLSRFSKIKINDAFGYWIMQKNLLFYYNYDHQLKMSTVRSYPWNSGLYRYYMTDGHTFNIYFKPKDTNIFTIEDGYKWEIPYYTRNRCEFII